MNQPTSQQQQGAPPPDLVGRGTFLGHPKGLSLLFFVEMWERFSYYGMRGLLVLYLTAALAPHQLPAGRYTNSLSIKQSVVATEQQVAEKQEPPVLEQKLPLSVLVGSGPALDAKLTGEAGPLKIQRVVGTGKNDENGNAIWQPVGDGFEPFSLSATAGKPPTDKEVHYLITNPTDRPVKLTTKLERPYSAEDIAKDEKLKDKDNPNYKVYFKVNDGTSVLSTTIHPDAKRRAIDPQFVLTIDTNRTDSGRSWLKADANNLYGWYTGMVYLLPILGGLIADKLIGTHRSVIVGGLLIALGHIVLSLSGLGDFALNKNGMTIFVMGLSLITIGTGHFKPCVSVMVGQLYPMNDPRRESAFSVFYMGINLGSFLCNLACGYLSVAYGWHYGFGAAAVGMLISIATYIMLRPRWLGTIGNPPEQRGSAAFAMFPIGVLLAAGVAGLFHVGALGKFDELMSTPIAFGLSIAFGIGYAIWSIVKQAPEDRGPVFTIFIYMLFNALFWLSFEQAGSSLNTFTDELTDRRFMGSVVPSPYFQSINPLLIIIFAPMFGLFWASLARKKKSFPQPFKIGLGLIFVGLGYVVMVMAAMRLNTGIPKVGMIFISGCYFLHTVGEIILSPTGLSYVAKTAPKNQVSSLMGIWFISSFIAGLSAGKVGALVDPIIEGKMKMPWNLGGQADFFLLFVITSCAAGVLIMLIGAFLTKLQRDPKH